MPTADLRAQDATTGHPTLRSQNSELESRGTVYDGGAHSQPTRPHRISSRIESDPSCADRCVQPSPSQTDPLETNRRRHSSNHEVQNQPCEKAERFLEVLGQAGSSELRRVQVQVVDGKVVLFGRVTSYYHKQVAQESVRPLAIGMEIENKIDVAR